MTKQELRSEYIRLLSCNAITDSYDLINIYLEYLFLVVTNHQKDIANTLAERDAKIVNQMMFTKVAHLKQVAQGIDFTSKTNVRLNKIIDPTFVGVLIRNIFETVGMFNLINIHTKNEDEKTILYNLWVIAGLNYRQRFGNITSTDENKKKLENEEKEIAKYSSQIEKTNLYCSLTDKNKKQIAEKIKQKDFKIKFDSNNDVKSLSWQDLISVMGIKEKLMGDIYTYFSLYAHPSNVAVFQFASLFEKENAYFLEMTNFNLRNGFLLISVFIADYIALFPTVIKTFNSLALRDQVAINAMNIFARGDNFSINNAVFEL